MAVPDGLLGLLFSNNLGAATRTLRISILIPNNYTVLERERNPAPTPPVAVDHRVVINLYEIISRCWVSPLRGQFVRCRPQPGLHVSLFILFPGEQGQRNDKKTSGDKSERPDISHWLPSQERIITFCHRIIGCNGNTGSKDKQDQRSGVSHRLPPFLPWLYSMAVRCRLAG